MYASAQIHPTWSRHLNYDSRLPGTLYLSQERYAPGDDLDFENHLPLESLQARELLNLTSQLSKMNWYAALISHKDNENALVSQAKHNVDIKEVQKVKYTWGETIL